MRTIEANPEQMDGGVDSIRPSGRIAMIQLLPRTVLSSLGAVLIAGSISWITLVVRSIYDHVPQSKEFDLEFLWIVGCALVGFGSGLLFRNPWMKRRDRWIGRGVVCALAALCLTFRLLIWLDPLASAVMIVRGMRFEYDLARSLVLSTPAAILVGGFVGWFFERSARGPEHEPAD